MALTPQQIQDFREAVIKSLNSCVDSNAERLGCLRDRWQDEKEYEDFNDYVAIMKKMVPEGFEFIKATKSPFGFQVKHPKIRRCMVVYANASSVTWKMAGPGQQPV